MSRSAVYLVAFLVGAVGAVVAFTLRPFVPIRGDLPGLAADLG